MAAETHAHDGTANRKAKEVHAHDGTAWRKAKEIHAHDGTAWRKVFVGFTPADAISDVVVYEFLSTAVAQLAVNTDGTCGAGTWGTPTTTGIGSSYYVKVDLVSGDTPTGTLGSYLALSSARTWNLTASTTPGNTQTKSCTLNVSISADGSTALYTASVYLEATADLS